MLQHKGTGGETVLVDGFKAAENLKREDPDAFEILTRNVIESEYIETKTIHFAATNPVIKLHPVTKELFHIRLVCYVIVFQVIRTIIDGMKGLWASVFLYVLNYNGCLSD